MRRVLIGVATAAMLALAACDRQPEPQDAGSSQEPPPLPAPDAGPAEATEPAPGAPQPVPEAAEPWAPQVAPIDAEAVVETLERADAARERGELIDGADAALPLYLSVLDADPDNAVAVAGVDHIVAVLLERGREALAEGSLGQAGHLLTVLQSVRPEAEEVLAFEAQLAIERAIRDKLEQARRRAEAGQLVAPEGRSAAAAYREILAEHPGHPAAEAGLADLESRLVAAALDAAGEGDYRESDRLLADAARLRPDSDLVQDASTRIVEMRQQRAQSLQERVLAAIEAGELERAELLVEQLGEVSAQGEGLEELRLKLLSARHYGGYRPGDVFRDPLDEGRGPAMVVIPRGDFRMGSPAREKNRAASEGPQHTVVLEHGFALGQSEVTVGEFRRFVQATGYRPTSAQAGASVVYDEKTGAMSEKPGVNWQDDYTGRRADAAQPVIHVSWNDAQAYADWLARQTGRRYRLPSEGEFEYALRAGSQTRYPWGEDPPMRVVGNLTGAGDVSPSGRKWVNAFNDYADGYWGPAPVRSFEPNPFGLYDMAGNVSEWVADCWHDNYRRAPADGSAWVNPGCTRYVVRGGSWASAPDQVRSAFRLAASPRTVNPRLGFRVARDLVAEAP